MSDALAPVASGNVRLGRQELPASLASIPSAAEPEPAVILGLDPAWADSRRSGVALIRRHRGGQWEFVAAASSYSEFCGGPGSAGVCEPAQLLRMAEHLAGPVPDVMLADVPLAILPHHRTPFG